MRYHSQNLNESSTGVIKGSALWHGRAWLKKAEYRDFLHWEWCLGKYATMFHFGIIFGDGDGEDGILLIAGIPWLFSFWFGIAGVWSTPEKEIGISIHHNTLYIHTFSLCNEWHSKDPWWKKGLSWYFPWDWQWFSTEVLEHTSPDIAKTVHLETKPMRLGDGNKSREAAKAVSRVYPYVYKLKSGICQQRLATVFVQRMTWRMKWWWLLPFRHQRTSIEVNFNEEVGEKPGSWKGGCLGCSYDMLPHETPEECLRRMEKERSF